MKAVIVAVAGALILAMTTQAQSPLPAASIDPWQARAAQLEQQLAAAEADVLRLEIEKSNLVATVQERDHHIESMQYSERVLRLLDKYRAMFGGEWYWDSGANKPAKKKEEAPK